MINNKPTLFELVTNRKSASAAPGNAGFKRQKMVRAHCTPPPRPLCPPCLAHRLTLSVVDVCAVVGGVLALFSTNQAHPTTPLYSTGPAI